MRAGSCGRGGWWKRLLVLAAVLGAGAAGVAQQPPADEAPPAKPLPEGLRHVPADAMGFIHFRLGDFLKSDIGKVLAMQLKRNPDSAKALEMVERELGISLTDIDSVTLLMLEPAFMDALGGPAAMAFRPTVAVPDVRSMPFEAPVPPALPTLPKDAAPPKVDDKKPDLPFEGDESPVSLQPELRDEMMMLLEQSHRQWGPLVILTTKQPVDRKKLLRKFVLPEPHIKQPAGQPIQQIVQQGPFSRQETSVLFLSDRAFMVGPVLEIWRYTDHVSRETRSPRLGAAGKGAARGGPGKPAADGVGGAGGKAAAAAPAAPLRQALALGAEPHLVVAGGQFAGLRNFLLLASRGLDDPEARTLAPLLPLLGVASGALTLDLGRTAELKIHLQGSNTKSAALAAEAAKTGLVLLDLGIERLLQDKSALPDDIGLAVATELLKKSRKTLAAATVVQENTKVLIDMRCDIDAKTVSQAVTALVGEVRKAGDRNRRTNHLQQIALAMHNYHDTMKGFPPAALSSVKNRDGKPLLSWRVAILPYIEQHQLYQKFDLELPWDHPHNKKLIEQMPEIYVVPGTKSKEPGLTHYQVLVGPGTAFEPKKGQTLTGTRMLEVLDGTSNTIMVVEAAEPVIWTKPEDVPFNPKEPLPKLGVLGDGFYAAMCDGSVRFIRRTVNEQTLRALITRNGGEVVPGDVDR